MKTPILHKTQELVAPESIYLQWEGVPILERGRIDYFGRLSKPITLIEVYPRRNRPHVLQKWMPDILIDFAKYF